MASTTRFRLLLGIGAGAVLIAAVLAPRFPALYAAFHSLCHQRPDRCFAWSGRPLAVCARCLGFYTGVLLGAARPWKADWRVLAALLAANAVEYLSGGVGLGPRFALAAAFAWPAVAWLASPGSAKAH